MILRKRSAERPGYVLIAVLVVIVVLSLAAYRFTDSMSAEHRAAVRVSDAAQARAAAASGIHYTAALLADPDAFTNYLGGNPTLDNAEMFGEVPVRVDQNNPGRNASFRIVAVAMTGPGIYEQRAAVIDEGAKLNINALIAQDKTGEVLYNALLKIPDMSPDTADAIVDWVDADDTPRTNGAESTTYQSLNNPYSARTARSTRSRNCCWSRGSPRSCCSAATRTRTGRAMTAARRCPAGGPTTSRSTAARSAPTRPAN
jgi:type II secretory pathway component PulK